MTLREVHQLAQLCARFFGQPWQAKADELWQGEDFLGRLANTKLADYISTLHNAALPLTNCIVMLSKQLVDARKMRNEQ